MSREIELLKHLYDRFNARDMDAVLATMHKNVEWANGLEGGFVYGHEGVRNYWTRQWAAMDSRAEPLSFSVEGQGKASAEVHLTARDVSGNVLFDTRGRHLFEIEDGLVKRFDIVLKSIT